MLRPRLVISATLALLLMAAGCAQKDINNAESVRTAVLEHIEARGDLNVAELDITVEQTQFSGDRCEATVAFSPKGTPPGAGMTMNYTLLRDGDQWKVQPRPPSAGSPHTPTEPMPPAGAPAGELPPGHPPVSPEPGQRN